MAETTTSTDGAKKQLSLLGRAATRGKARDAKRQARADAKAAAGPTRREQRQAARAGPETRSMEEQVAPIVEATENLDTVADESLQGERDQQDENIEAATAISDEQKEGQDEVIEKFDDADSAAEEGLEDVKAEVQSVQDLVEGLPGAVKEAFDEAKVGLDATFETARVGLEDKSGAALGNVMEGRAGAMEAATASIHGATRQQMSQIDAQVQQGILSPSQATAMKAKIKMGASMQLSAAVGQTAHMFTATQAKVATDFGNMFTSMESVAGQVEGQFGAAAAGSFAAASTVLSNVNLALVNTTAAATAQRDTMLATNAAARGTVNNMNDDAGRAMMEYTQPMYISEYPYSVNGLTAATDLAETMIKLEEMQATIALMEEAGKTERRRGRLGILGAILQNLRG